MAVESPLLRSSVTHHVVDEDVYGVGRMMV